MSNLSDAVKERINNILGDKLMADVSSITEETKIKEDLGADSIDEVEIIMDLEKEFYISIEDALAERVVTVGDLYKLVGIKTA